MTETRERPYRCKCCADGNPAIMCEHGTRADLINALERMSVECYLYGKDELSRAATEAVNGLRAGSFSVKVGHTIYSVADEKA